MKEVIERARRQGWKAMRNALLKSYMVTFECANCGKIESYLRVAEDEVIVDLRAAAERHANETMNHNCGPDVSFKIDNRVGIMRCVGVAKMSESDMSKAIKECFNIGLW